MMFKLQVWSPVQKHWRTVYARSPAALEANVALLRSYGFPVR